MVTSIYIWPAAGIIPGPVTLIFQFVGADLLAEVKFSTQVSCLLILVDNFTIRLFYLGVYYLQLRVLA